MGIPYILFITACMSRGSYRTFLCINPTRMHVSWISMALCYLMILRVCVSRGFLSLFRFLCIDVSPKRVECSSVFCTYPYRPSLERIYIVRVHSVLHCKCIAVELKNRQRAAQQCKSAPLIAATIGTRTADLYIQTHV